MKILFQSFSLVVLSALLYADCPIDYSVMYVLAGNEKHITKDIGYPYLISFNNTKDAEKARDKLALNWLDGRTVDCTDLTICKSNLKEINSLMVTNLDLGAFQINQDCFNFENTDQYFVLKKSYEKACNIVYSHYQ